MTQLLVRMFVKNYSQTDNTAVRTRYGILASAVGIGCNLLLFCAKLAVGLVLGSVSVIADACNNLSDAASSIIGLVGVRMAQKPADKDHPFGHGRIEYIAAFIVAFLVIQVGFALLQTSAQKIIHPEALSFSGVSVAILLGSVGVKLWLSLFNRTLGKRIHSSVMTATAADALGDVAATSATIVSILVFGIWGVDIDGLVGVAVSVLVMIAGINIAKDTLEPLIGAAIDPQLYESITRFVESYPGILGSHDLIVHNYGPGRHMASIHVEVSSDVSIEDSHNVVDEIERDTYRELGILLVIHMDPVNVRDLRRKEWQTKVEEIIKELDPKLSIHDFRVVQGSKRRNLVFDLVVPHSYDEKKQEELREQISKRVLQEDEHTYCVIQTESSYLEEKE